MILKFRSLCYIKNIKDNTERGKDVDMNNINELIYMNIHESTESNESTSANDNSTNS